MRFFKWFGFLLLCTDTISYMCEKLEERDMDPISVLIVISGIILRINVLYGAATYWLLV